MHSLKAEPSDLAEPATISRFKHLTEVVLPALALQHRWPLRFDHCFKRVCLDHAFQDVWYKHLRKPAERHLAGDALERAIVCAEAIAARGLPELVARNQESLGLRGKQPRTSRTPAARIGAGSRAGRRRTLR